MAGFLGNLFLVSGRLDFSVAVTTSAAGIFSGRWKVRWKIFVWLFSSQSRPTDLLVVFFSVLVVLFSPFGRCRVFSILVLFLAASCFILHVVSLNFWSSVLLCCLLRCGFSGFSNCKFSSLDFSLVPSLCHSLWGPC